MTKHTPGPWTHETLIPLSFDDAPRFSIGHISERSIGSTGVANALLIAAAPDLLEALRAVVSLADAQFRAGDTHCTISKQTIETLRPAIAKAEGR